MYLSSIQQGIQAAHATHDMFVAYRDRPGAASDFLWEWATNHKTMILLNGGYLETMEQLWWFLDYTTDKPYPYAKFHEGTDSMGGMLTSIGIVLPEKIYLTAAAMRRDRPKCGETSIADLIQSNGYWVVDDDNEYGFILDKDSACMKLEFTKWEFELMNRLNGFNMAS